MDNQTTENYAITKDTYIKLMIKLGLMVFILNVNKQWKLQNYLI